MVKNPKTGIRVSLVLASRVISSSRWNCLSEAVERRTFLSYSGLALNRGSDSWGLSYFEFKKHKEILCQLWVIISV